jgi:DNA (cytosine-5)-methyltransferase 1
VKYLSVCSGIEAASVAWHPLGWQPLAFSEIEPFPRAVLAHHYPDTPLHGDFTVLRDQPWIEDADILVGGTPCQAFSVAGLRNSLADDRGNLSLEYVRLADAIDNFRLAAGRQPAVIVWENVPGVLSVKDNAFGCFLAALAGDVAPYVPPRGKWTNAGVVIGPERAVAWRILDAQYFGVAQRRRRVFVCGVALSHPRAREIATSLFPLSESVSRHPPARGQAREIAPTIPSRSTAGGGLGTDFDLDGGVIRAVDVCPTLRAGGNKTGGDRPPGTDVDTADSLIVMSSGQANAEIRTDGGTPALTCLHEAPIVAHTLKGEGFDGGEDGTGRGTPLVPVIQPIPFDTTQITSPSNYSKPGEGDPCHPLAAGAHPPAIAFPAFMSGTQVAATEELAPAMGAENQTAVAYAFQPRIARNGRGDMGDIVNALNAQSGETGKGDAAPCVAYDVTGTGPNMKSGGRETDVHVALRARAPGTSEGSTTTMIQHHMAVRRLTPVECERLQGFPDNYTAIPWRKAAAEDCPDGPRYKALGNSMAVPCMRWIGERIANEIKEIPV